MTESSFDYGKLVKLSMYLDCWLDSILGSVTSSNEATIEH